MTVVEYVCVCVAHTGECDVILHSLASFVCICNVCIFKAAWRKALCKNVCVILSGFEHTTCIYVFVVCAIVEHTSFWVVGVLSPSNRRADRQKKNKRTQTIKRVKQRIRAVTTTTTTRTTTITASLEFLFGIDIICITRFRARLINNIHTPFLTYSCAWFYAVRSHIVCARSSKNWYSQSVICEKRNRKWHIKSEN